METQTVVGLVALVIIVAFCYVIFFTSEEHEIRNTLSSSRRKLEQIAKEKNTIRQKETELLKTIERCEQRIAPWKNLNDECLRHVFVCLSEDYGSVGFPLERGLPPQLIISHVCSRWRVLSLSTRSIWANVQIHERLIGANHRTCFRWLGRAGCYPVSLAIDLEEFQSHIEAQFVLSTFLQAVRVRTLNIKLDSHQFEAMHTPESIRWYSGFEGIKLAFIFVVNRNDEQFDFHHRHQLLKRTNTVTFRGRYAKIGKNIKTEYFPWAQLLYLDIQDCKDLTLQEAMGILRQTTIIEELYVEFKHQPVNIDGLEKVTLSCLRKLRLSLDLDWPTGGFMANNDFLEAFECPNLVEFHLYTARDWSPETYNLLKRQYNLENLEQLDMSSFTLGCCLPMSCILRDAPMLQRLGLTNGITIDDDAISGIAIGTLGRCLSSIWFRSEDNYGFEQEAIDMILSRQKNARRLISESRNWKEEISLFRKIYCDVNYWISSEASIRALKEAGVKVEIISTASLEEEERPDDPFRPSFRTVVGFDDL